MNSVVAFIASFLIAFLLATGGMFYMNMTYNNIWKFDFRSLAQVEEEKLLAEEQAKADSLGITVGEEDLQKIEDQPKDEPILVKPVVQSDDTADKEAELEAKKEADRIKKEEYLQWAKSTAKIYESMDSGAAAKIIQNYSDSVARDVIYYMKKKKAAAVLAVLDPKLATRITRAN